MRSSKQTLQALVSTFREGLPARSLIPVTSKFVIYLGRDQKKLFVDFVQEEVWEGVEK
jgi:hypothetical protein